MSNPTLIIFYDSSCPLCYLEMMKLKQHDVHNKILLEDLHQENLAHYYPNINVADAMKILHGQYNGETLFGLAVTHRAWTLVGKGTFVAPLKWPLIKQIANILYLIVAKYRRPISYFMYTRLGIGKNNCKAGVCYDKTKR